MTYWADWAPDAESAARGRRFTRVGASMFLVSDQLRSLHADTARAVLHHLDLVAELPLAPGPGASGLAEVRRVLDALLGHPGVGWDDERCARVATGRAQPTSEEARALGPLAGRLPVIA